MKIQICVGKSFSHSKQCVHKEQMDSSSFISLTVLLTTGWATQMGIQGQDGGGRDSAGSDCESQPEGRGNKNVCLGDHKQLGAAESELEEGSLPFDLVLSAPMIGLRWREKVDCARCREAAQLAEWLSARPLEPLTLGLNSRFAICFLSDPGQRA